MYMKFLSSIYVFQGQIVSFFVLVFLKAFMNGKILKNAAVYEQKPS